MAEQGAGNGNGERKAEVYRATWGMRATVTATIVVLVTEILSGIVAYGANEREKQQMKDRIHALEVAQAKQDGAMTAMLTNVGSLLTSSAGLSQEVRDLERQEDRLWPKRP